MGNCLGKNKTKDDKNSPTEAKEGLKVHPISIQSTTRPSIDLQKSIDSSTFNQNGPTSPSESHTVSQSEETASSPTSKNATLTHRQSSKLTTVTEVTEQSNKEKDGNEWSHEQAIPEDEDSNLNNINVKYGGQTPRIMPTPLVLVSQAEQDQVSQKSLKLSRKEEDKELNPVLQKDQEPELNPVTSRSPEPSVKPLPRSHKELDGAQEILENEAAQSKNIDTSSNHGTEISGKTQFTNVTPKPSPRVPKSPQRSPESVPKYYDVDSLQKKGPRCLPTPDLDRKLVADVQETDDSKRADVRDLSKDVPKNETQCQAQEARPSKYQKQCLKSDAKALAMFNKRKAEADESVIESSGTRDMKNLNLRLSNYPESSLAPKQAAVPQSPSTEALPQSSKNRAAHHSGYSSADSTERLDRVLGNIYSSESREDLEISLSNYPSQAKTTSNNLILIRSASDTSLPLSEAEAHQTKQTPGVGQPLDRVPLSARAQGQESKARDMYQHCQEQADGSVLISTGKVDHKSNAKAYTVARHSKEARVLTKTGNWGLPDDVLKQNELEKNISSKGKALFESRKKFVNDWTEKTDKQREKTLSLLNKSNDEQVTSATSIASKNSSLRELQDSLIPKNISEPSHSTKHSKGVVTGQYQPEVVASPREEEETMQPGKPGKVNIVARDSGCLAETSLKSASTSRADSATPKSSPSKANANANTNTNAASHKEIEAEYLSNTQKFYDDYFGKNAETSPEMTLDRKSNNLSTHGAVELSKNYHESVDELLKLCDEVTIAAGNSIEQQGVSKNDSSDPVSEDMFKRKVDHQNRATTTKKTNETEFDLDKITKAIYNKEYGEPNSPSNSPRTPFR